MKIEIHTEIQDELPYVMLSDKDYAELMRIKREYDAIKSNYIMLIKKIESCESAYFSIDTVLELCEWLIK